MTLAKAGWELATRSEKQAQGKCPGWIFSAQRGQDRSGGRALLGHPAARDRSHGLLHSGKANDLPEDTQGLPLFSSPSKSGAPQPYKGL